jgi:lysophospholipid acyltransferase (LPLAT)-like uncharacterized protein
MKLRQPWLIAMLARVGATAIRLWMATVRTRWVFLDGVEHPTDPNRRPYIYAFWHETMLLPATVQTPIRVLISTHADGELIAQTCRRLGYEVVRGSSTRHGQEALLGLCRGGEGKHVAFTPDGPRGPRRQVKAGLLYLASRTGIPIVPVGVGFSQPWRARSWDRFALPRPFSRAWFVYGAAVTVPPGLDREKLEPYRRQVESDLVAVTDVAERGVAGLKAECGKAEIIQEAPAAASAPDS